MPACACWFDGMPSLSFLLCDGQWLHTMAVSVHTTPAGRNAVMSEHTTVSHHCVTLLDSHGLALQTYAIGSGNNVYCGFWCIVSHVQDIREKICYGLLMPWMATAGARAAKACKEATR